MRVFMNKNCLYLLTGGAMFLCAGVCGRKAYAVDYPNAATLEDYWKKTLYYQAFEKLYRQAKEFPLLSDNLPRDGQTPSFKMYFNGKENPFKTASDLDQLPCDAHLKKICKVLCSSKFLATALLQETVDTLRKGSGVVMIKIKALNCEHFFGKYGEGKLEMRIKRDTEDPNEKFSARFVFVFKKTGSNVSIQAIRFRAELPTGQAECFSDAYVLRTPLPDFPYDDLLRAPKNIASAWSQLPSDPVITEVIAFTDVSVEWKQNPSSFDRETERKFLSYGRRLRSRDFFEGIFGKSILDIFEYECSMSIYKPGLWIGYVIVPLCKKELSCDPVDELDIRLWIMNAIDDKIFQGGPKRSHNRCLNVISDLHFVLDIEKNKIYNAEFRGNLKINGKIFMEDGSFRDARPIQERGTMADD